MPLPSVKPFPALGGTTDKKPSRTTTALQICLPFRFLNSGCNMILVRSHIRTKKAQHGNSAVSSNGTPVLFATTLAASARLQSYVSSTCPKKKSSNPHAIGVAAARREHNVFRRLGQRGEELRPTPQLHTVTAGGTSLPSMKPPLGTYNTSNL